VTSTRDSNFAGLHRLPEDLKAVTTELWQFVQKQHAAVSKGNFSRTGRAATADESHSAGTVVWITKWSLKDKIGVAARAVNIA
jgi:hypothetical protein